MGDYREIILNRRIERKMSQQQLAELVGVSQSLINHIEHGRKNPSVEVLVRICKVLDIEFMTIPEGRG